MENNYRPTRLDHFPSMEPGKGSRLKRPSKGFGDQKPALKLWLEDHNLPVATKETHGMWADAENLKTMHRATGGRTIGV